MPEGPHRSDVRSADTGQANSSSGAPQEPAGSGLTPSTRPGELKSWVWPNGFTCPQRRLTFASAGRTGSQWSGRTHPCRGAVLPLHGVGEYYEIDRPHRLVMSGRAVNDEQGELFATLIEVPSAARRGAPRSPCASPIRADARPLRRGRWPSRAGPSQLDKLEAAARG